MLKHLSGSENKENSKSPRSIDSEIHISLEGKVLEHINNNLVIVMDITNLRNYYQWVSLFPNLEKLSSTRFLNETRKPKDLINKQMITQSPIDMDKIID